jgi:hypothetical protein
LRHDLEDNSASIEAINPEQRVEACEVRAVPDTTVPT